MLAAAARWLASPRRALALVGAGTTLLTLARVLVLVIEAYSAVWAERAADRDLMQLCESGTGSVSPDFRALCLKKRAEQAAPVFLKAILRAVTIAFTDFVEAFSSPTRVVLLILFTLTGVAAPVVKAVSAIAVDNLKRRRRRTRMRAHSCESGTSSDEDDNDKQTIVVVGAHGAQGGRRGYSLMPRMLQGDPVRAQSSIVNLPHYYG